MESMGKLNETDFVSQIICSISYRNQHFLDYQEAMNDDSYRGEVL